MLTANAARWTPPSGLESSRRRFTATAEAVRAHGHPGADQARVRAATVSSPSRALGPDAPPPVPADAVAVPVPAIAHRSR
ncbi:hypothetical protein [Streptomyces sp. NRRL WC-3742]|uniref:hypothetical protein n=1 Tax=Streptomyces sp. NRRL WC-3742 TaxID=1463934 RepID=UPI00131E2C5D|nr:hypothetical protein [Streptomyces sp. NRRL WC-3742]